jgi:hypothetical protein
VTAPAPRRDAEQVHARVVQALKSAGLWHLLGGEYETNMPGDVVTVAWLQHSKRWQVTLWRYTHRTTPEQRADIVTVANAIGQEAEERTASCTFLVDPGPMAGYPGRTAPERTPNVWATGTALGLSPERLEAAVAALRDRDLLDRAAFTLGRVEQAVLLLAQEHMPEGAQPHERCRTCDVLVEALMASEALERLHHERKT